MWYRNIHTISYKKYWRKLCFFTCPSRGIAWAKRWSVLMKGLTGILYNCTLSNPYTSHTHTHMHTHLHTKNNSWDDEIQYHTMEVYLFWNIDDGMHNLSLPCKAACSLFFIRILQLRQCVYIVKQSTKYNGLVFIPMKISRQFYITSEFFYVTLGKIQRSFQWKISWQSYTNECYFQVKKYKQESIVTSTWFCLFLVCFDTVLNLHLHTYKIFFYTPPSTRLSLPLVLFCGYDTIGVVTSYIEALPLGNNLDNRNTSWGRVNVICVCLLSAPVGCTKKSLYSEWKSTSTQSH